MVNLISEKKDNPKYRQSRFLSLFLGILIGFGFYYVKTLCTFGENVIYKDDISGTVVKIEESVSAKIITLAEGNNPFVRLAVDKIRRQVEAVGIYDSQDRLLGDFQIKGGQISFIRLLTQKNVPFFEMKYDDTLKHWYDAAHFKITENGKIISEMYFDTNIDGQFDRMIMFNRLGEVENEAIFFNGAWYVAILSDDNMSAEAYWKENGEKIKIDLLFNFDKGWIPTSGK